MFTRECVGLRLAVSRIKLTGSVDILAQIEFGRCCNRGRGEPRPYNLFGFV